MNPPRYGLVVAAYRRQFLVEADDGQRHQCVMRGRQLLPACGDRVSLSGHDDQVVVTAIETRVSLFWRANAYREKIIAANVDQVVGVVAVDPVFSEELLNRWIVAAEANRCRFILVLNKMDLAGADRIYAQLAQYAKLGYCVVPLCAKREVGPLAALLEHRKSVLVGQSGMGKSTLINALVPSAGARIGELSAALQAGKHTTTNSHLYRLDADGWVIDSPGLQEFGLHHLNAQQIEEGFAEFRGFRGGCKFRDCLHLREPGCALREAARSDPACGKRLDYLRRFQDEVARGKER